MCRFVLNAVMMQISESFSDRTKENNSLKTKVLTK